MIVAYSFIYHRPSSSSPIVFGASSSSSSPTNRNPFRARAARMEKSSPPIVADRPKDPPATNDRARRPSTSFPAPGVAAIARQADVDRPAPSSERARRGELLMQHTNAGFCQGVSTMCPSVT